MDDKSKEFRKMLDQIKMRSIPLPRVDRTFPFDKKRGITHKQDNIIYVEFRDE